MKLTRRTGLKMLAAGTAAIACPGIVRAEEEEIVIGAPNSLTGGLGENGQRATAFSVPAERWTRLPNSRKRSCVRAQRFAQL